MACGSLAKAELSLKKAMMSLLKALALGALLLPEPAKAAPDFPWWNIRFFDGQYYLADSSTGWQQALEDWETESLEEAMLHDQEMEYFIHGHSWLETGALDGPPIWSSQSQQWLVHPGPLGPMDQPAIGLDLRMFQWRARERLRKEREQQIRDWSEWEDACKGKGKGQQWQRGEWRWVEPAKAWDSRSSSSTACGSWSSWETPQQPHPPNSGSHPRWSDQRYLGRGWGSACKRWQKRAYEQRGETPPDHLMPQRIKLAKGYKKQMAEILKASKQAQRAESEDDLPSCSESESKSSEPAKARESSDSEESERQGYYRSGMGSAAARGTSRGKHGPRYSPNLPPVSEEPAKAKAEEKEDDEEEEDEPGKAEEMEVDDEEEDGKKKKRRRRRRKRTKSPVKDRDESEDPGKGHGPDKGPGGAGVTNPAATTLTA